MNCAFFPNVYFVFGIIYNDRQQSKFAITCGFGNQKELALAHSLPEQHCGLHRKPLTASRRLFGIYAEIPGIGLGRS
jgi:hypothetical protein